MRVNLTLLALTFCLSLLVGGGKVPPFFALLGNLSVSAGLIFLFGRLPAAASLGWSLALAASAGWMVKSWMAAAVYSALTVLPAAAVGLAAAKKLSYGRVLLVLAASACLPLALFLFFAYPSVKLELLAAGASLKESLVTTGRLFDSVPMKLEEMQKALTALVEFVVRVAPALYYLSTFFLLALAHLLAIWGLGRTGRVFPGPRNFLSWQAPFFFTFLLGMGLAGHLFLENGFLKAADNLLLLVIFVYAVCGASNLEFFFKKMSAHWAVKSLFYLWLAIFGLASFLVLSAVGFLDSRFDFRRLKALPLAKEGEE